MSGLKQIYQELAHLQAEVEARPESELSPTMRHFISLLEQAKQALRKEMANDAPEAPDFTKIGPPAATEIRLNG